MYYARSEAMKALLRDAPPGTLVGCHSDTAVLLRGCVFCTFAVFILKCFAFVFPFICFCFWRQMLCFY